jgi:transcriptional regulator with XRE-family HTH domain
VVVQTEQEPQTAGELIRFWRTGRGLSQLELSLDANVSTKHLSFVETGRSGSNGRPPACKARADAAVYCRLSLRPLRERSLHSRCGLLRFAASKPLPRQSRREVRERD